MNLFSKPTVEYCEKATDFIISRPGYAISNIPYLILGVFLLKRGKEFKTTKYFGIFSIMIGCASFFYDATYTLLSQLIDLSVMFLFINFLLLLNVKRLVNKKNINRNYFVIYYLLSFILFLSLTYIIGGSTGRILFGFVTLLTCSLEIFLFKKLGNYSIKYWTIAFSLLIIGFNIWMLDAKQIWCDPMNVFNGRSLFHYFTAGSIFYLSKHYEKLEGMKVIK